MHIFVGIDSGSADSGNQRTVRSWLAFTIDSASHCCELSCTPLTHHSTSPLPGLHPAVQDRWAQHTAHCAVCQAALRGVEQQLFRAKAAAAVLFAILCGALGAGALAQQGVARTEGGLAAVGLVVCLMVARSAASTVQQFKYVEFNHHNNH